MGARDASEESVVVVVREDNERMNKTSRDRAWPHQNVNLREVSRVLSSPVGGDGGHLRQLSEQSHSTHHGCLHAQKVTHLSQRL